MSIDLKECDRCGTEFAAWHPKKRFCSKRCQTQAATERYVQKHSEIAQCQGCGQDFQRRARASTKARYCSTQCRWEGKRYDSVGVPDGVTGLSLRGSCPTDNGIGAYLDALTHDPCSYCGALGEGRGQLDHIEPRAAGGENHWENYAPICASCNASKHKKSVVAFLGWRQAAAHFDGWRRLAESDTSRHRADSARRAVA